MVCTKETTRLRKTEMENYLSSGFHQIPMDPESKKYTAFSTPQGHYHYDRLPFELKNAPAAFQRMIDTKNTTEICNIVLQRLKELGLKVQPDKCEFLKPELEYLGHIVTAEGVKPNPKKIEGIKIFRQPKNPTEVKSFLGLADMPFHWSDKTQDAFDTLKEKLCDSPVLKYRDYDKPFVLTTDAKTEKNEIKRMILFYNSIDKDKEFTLARGPIQEYTEEQMEEILQENHDLISDSETIGDNWSPNVATVTGWTFCLTEVWTGCTTLPRNVVVAAYGLKNGPSHMGLYLGAPKKILTDRGENFISDLMQKYEEAFKIKHIKSTSFHPQGNGLLKRAHGVIVDMLKTVQKDSEKELDEHLNFICLAYNTMICDATGYTLFELTFGHKANLPSTIARKPRRTCADEVAFRKREWDSRLSKARDQLIKSKQRYQRDQRRRIIKPQSIFKEGDRVLIHNDHKEHKLDIKWLEPYTIEKVKTPYYEVLIEKNINKINRNRLKPYFPGRSP
ncbi:uncharacterized protein [Bombus flavifrons]|uniref:uncharacterized protein n=1 Tax=Bombus flavifrons TaxID=103934 RepID=UPI003704C6D2